MPSRLHIFQGACRLMRSCIRSPQSFARRGNSEISKHNCAAVRWPPERQKALTCLSAAVTQDPTLWKHGQSSDQKPGLATSTDPFSTSGLRCIQVS